MEWIPYAVGVAVATVGTIFIFRRRTASKQEEAGTTPPGTVVLHQFPRGPYAPSMSAFCLKLETFLRMENIPYKNVFSYKSGPKGKQPWAEFNGSKMADSQLIMATLSEQLQIDLNKNLSPEQRAIAHSFQKLVDEHTYWLVLIERWVNHRGDTAKTLTKLPSLVVWEIGRRTKNMTYAQGLGRHTPEEVENLLEKDLEALSDFLGEKKFMFGDEPNTVDCSVFGQLSQVKWHVPDSVKGKTLLQETYRNLNSYCDRMKEKFWPDWDDCISRGFTRAPAKKTEQ